MMYDDSIDREYFSMAILVRLHHSGLIHVQYFLLIIF